VKATLLKALEEDAEPLSTIPHDAVWIVDAMAILQATKTTTNMTYSELASAVFNGITRGTQSDGCIDQVVDAHPAGVFVKNVERDRRSAAASLCDEDTLRGTEGRPTAEQVSEEWSIQG